MEGAQPPLAAGKTPGPLLCPQIPQEPSPGAAACPARLGDGLAHFPLSLPVSAEELTTPGLKKAHTPPLHEDANTAVIAGRGSPPRPPHRDRAAAAPCRPPRG